MPKQQYYENTLQPIQIDKTSLRQTLQALQHAVIQGTNVVQRDSPAPRNLKDYGSIYSGVTGTALAFLRLEHQKASLVDDERRHTSYLPDFVKLADERTLPVSSAPDIIKHAPPPGRMSPVGSSSLGSLIVRILAACEDPSRRSVSGDDIRALGSAVQHSLNLEHVISSASGDSRGVDEVLYGRAGLLWAVLSIRGYAAGDGELWRASRPVCEAVPRLVDVIVEAGKRGARDFVDMHGEKGGFPLMWLYKNERYSLGSMHGIAGILTILLSSNPEDLTTHLPLITETIDHLCKISIANNGHLPTSIPTLSSRSRTTPLVQICHGAPGLLILLATARKQPRLRADFWHPQWDEAMHTSASKVWEEGLLRKGGSLCHGLSGNAWALLTLHDAFEVDIERGLGDRKTQAASDYFLSRALALLLLARESPPYSTAMGIPSSYDFRLPDRPYNLFEGMAGELCAWAEACVAIQARLCKLGPDRDPVMMRKYRERELGFPCLGCATHLQNAQN